MCWINDTLSSNQVNTGIIWENNTVSSWVSELISNILSDSRDRGEATIASLKLKDAYKEKLFMSFQYWNLDTVWIFSQMEWFFDLTPDELSRNSSLLGKDINDIIPVINKMHQVLGDVNLLDIINYFYIFELTDDQAIPFLKANSEEYKTHIDSESGDDYVCKYWLIDSLKERWKEITIENIWRYNRREFEEESYENGFLNEFNSFVDMTWVKFSKKLLAKLFEENGSWFDRRFGNWFSIFTRNISLYINTWRTDEIFEEAPNDITISQLKDYKTNNPYFQWLLHQITSIFDESNISSYQLYKSWMNKRHKSCKDAETYFSFLISKNGWNSKIENFRIIWDFIEKNIDIEFQWFEEIWKSPRTAISRKDISVNGIFYPRWYLFRLNTKEEKVISVEPLRMTILWWWHKTKDFWAATFGSQFKEFNNLYELKDWEDVINTLEEILINKI